MADRTLTINHADGGSETYTLKTEDVLGVRNMSVDGETVTIDRTAPDLVRTIIADGQTITIDTTREGVRTLTVDGTEITIDRTEESNLESFLQQFTGASAAYSLRDLASNSGNTTVVRVRRSSDNAEADFKASEVSDGTLVTWVGAVNDGFVPTWYDQSGNGNDATQSVAGSQPKIVDAGVLVSGGILSDGTGTFLALDSALSITDEFDIFFTGTATASNWTSVQRVPYGFSTNFDYTRFNDDSFRYKIDNTESASTTYNGGFTIGAGTPFLYNFNRDASDSVGPQINGTAQTNRVTLHGTHKISQLFRRGANTTQVWDGTMSEMIFYDSDQSANRVAIETNINNQYDIY